MIAPFRGRIFNQAMIAAPAAEVWALLTDWAGVLKLRRPGSETGPLTLEKVELEGSPDSTPRTRALYFAGGLGVIRETLLHQDDAAMHLYYNMEGVGPLGLRNYLATTDVDELGPSITQITITARFDIEADADVARAKGVIDAAHCNSVIRGLQHYFNSAGG